MSLWGASIDKVIEAQYSSDGKFRILSEREKQMMKKQFVELPPARNTAHKIEIALESGILVEYLVDVGVITKDNVYDIDVGVEKRQFILDYIQYKDGDEVENIPMEMYLVAKDGDTFNKIRDGLEGCEFIGIEPILDFEGIKKILGGRGNIVVIISNEITEEQKDEIKVLYDLVKDKNMENFTFIDAGDVFQDKDDVYTLKELKGKYIRMAFNKSWDILRSVNDIVVDNVEVEFEDDLDGGIEDIKEDILNKEGDNLKYTEEELGEIVEEAVQAVRDKYDITLSKLKEMVGIKESQVNNLENRLDVSLEQVDMLRDNLRKTREKLQSLANELKYVEDENTELKEVKMLYEAIIDDYKELKELKKEHEAIIENVKNEYEVKIAEYIKIAENAEKSFKELKKAFDEYYENTEEGVDINYTSVVNIPVGYFRMLGEPRYFYSMIKYLIIYLKTLGKRVLLVAYKDPGFYLQPIFSDWVEINEIESDVDLENVDHKMYIRKVSKKETIKLENISNNYDVMIVLDFILRENVLVLSHEIKEVMVLKDINQSKDLKVTGNNIVYEEKEGSLIDISYDENMSKFTNERVKALFYKKRLKGWVEELIG